MMGHWLFLFMEIGESPVRLRKGPFRRFFLLEMEKGSRERRQISVPHSGKGRKTLMNGASEVLPFSGSSLFRLRRGF
ncbi:hypothetical protein CXU13_11230 [Akkermansia muciniphila]|nr:hypothetical protein CXU13_11230 [Akkermansia muciniphila]